MAMQLRRRGSNDPLYTPARDVAYLYDSALRTVAGLLEDGSDPTLGSLYQLRGTTMDDLGEAMGALCRFANLAHEDPQEDVEQAMRRAGWFHVDPAARVAAMYYVGTCMTATFFHGIRDALMQGQPTLASIQQLSWSMKRLMLFVKMSRWQRWKYRWLRPWRNKLWKHKKIRNV